MMKIKPVSSLRASFCPSFALISVLALVSLAALTATAFLASTRLESRANISLINSTRLEMALNAGSAAATELLDDGHGDQVSFVTTYWRGTGPNDWTNELGYLLNGSAPTAGTNTSLRFYACFSTATFTNLGTSLSSLVWVSNNCTNQGMFLPSMAAFMNTMTSFPPNQSTNIPLLGDTAANRYTSPPVGWVYIWQDVRIKPGFTNTTNIRVARFAFYVQDLGGLIDAQRNGALSDRSSGTNPEEISLISAQGSSLANSSFSSNLVANTNRWKYLSPGMLISSQAGALTTNDLRYVTAGLPQWNKAWATIPPGLGYADSTNAKYNLNTNNLSVATLATAVRTNLRQFSGRGGAMNGDAYLSNIAANIVDYVDANSDPTVDPASPIPAWRGVEAIAWPNEVYMRFNLNRLTNPPNYEFQLGVKHYLEVWNLGTNSVVVNGSDYAISNNLDIPLRCTNWNGNLKSADPTNPPVLEACTNPSFTLPPNSYGVIATKTRTFKILVPTNLAPNTTNPMLTIAPAPPTTTNNKYVLAYKDKIIDATKGGRWLGNSTNMRDGDFHFITTAVNFGSSANGTAYNLAGGDPRGGLFINQPAMDFSYTNTTPGGRNRYSSASGGANTVDPRVNWVDAGHSQVSDIVSSPGPVTPSANNSIAQGPQRQGNVNHWVQKCNDTGTFTNIMELGNIFDPIQWGDPNNPFHPRDTAAWMGLTNTATNFDGACGRNTLRLGRADHARFAFTNMGNGAVPAPNMMMSSAALLDLFSLSDTSTRYDEGGRINLNTAPAPVLRALAGGVILTNDPAQKPTNLAVPPAMAEAFAQGVMRFRSKYPFYSASQLAFIGTDSAWPNTNTWPTNSVFGNTNTIALSTAPGNSFGSSTKLGLTEWNDLAAEEWFSKIYKLATTQSRNYRVYVIAQLVDTNGNPTGQTSRKYYHIIARNNKLDPDEPDGASTYCVYESPY